MKPHTSWINQTMITVVVIRQTFRQQIWHTHMHMHIYIRHSDTGTGLDLWQKRKMCMVNIYTHYIMDQFTAVPYCIKCSNLVRHPQSHPDSLHAGVLAHPAPPVPTQQGEGYFARTLCCTIGLTVHPSGVLPLLCYYLLVSFFFFSLSCRYVVYLYVVLLC